MKANEAPEKIYISPNSEESTYYVSNQYNRLIEYTRADAFIKKAIDWLEDNAIEYWGTEAVDNGMMIEDFKKYMKGEEV